MLATRGWGVEEFSQAKPEFLAACRWLVMVERAMPEYQHALSAAAQPLDSGNVAAMQVKAASASLVNEWEPWLFPEDDDG